MNREEAKQLVRECWEDAGKCAVAGVTGQMVFSTFSALVAARLAPEPASEWKPVPNPDGKLVGEEPRPSYVPEGSPWEWTTLASGERVAMWVEPEGVDHMARIALCDPDPGFEPWKFFQANDWSGATIGPVALAAVEAFGRKHGVWS